MTIKGEFFIETDNNIIENYAGIQNEERNYIIECIKKLSKSYQPITYVEIGVLYGGTLRRIAQLFPRINCIGIDLFEDFKLSEDNTHGGNVTTLTLLTKNLNSLQLKNFTLYKGDSKDIVPTLDNIPYGVCVIDGNHSYEGCSTDFKNIYKKIHTGYIILHDWKMGGVYDTIMENNKLPEIRYEMRVNGISIIAKNIEMVK